MDMLDKANLLVLSHTYNSFIKDPIEIISKDFNKIYVLVRYKPIAELGNIIPLNFFKSRKKHSRRYSIDLTNKPDNVEIILVPLWYLPFKFFNKFIGPLHAKAVLRILKRRKIKFDIIHAHFGWSAGYAGMIIKEKYKKPLVITGHGYDVHDLPFRSDYWKAMMREIFTRADRLLTVSKKNRDYIKKINVKKKVTIINNGYSNSLFWYIEKEKAKNILNLVDNRKIILTIGNLEKFKGYDILIKALKIVFIIRKDFLCLHIGDGSKESYIKKLISEYDLNENVKLLGRKPHNELVYWFGACDFFISSSLFEGNPTVMFEALGCGKPFIGTEVGGIPEVIYSENYGLLSQPGNEKALAINIIKSLNLDWNSKEILEYSKQYRWENITRKIVEIYKELL